MTYSQVEDIILEQFVKGNFKLKREWDYGYRLYVIIPKTESNCKIVIEFCTAYWDEDKLQFGTRAMYDHHAFHIRECRLHLGWFKKQSIQIHDQRINQFLRDIERNFWAEQTRELLDQRKIQDTKMAAKLRKAFK